MSKMSEVAKIMTPSIWWSKASELLFRFMHIQVATHVLLIKPGPHPAQVLIRERTSYEYIRQLATTDPTGFWAPLARGALHWLHPHQQAWFTWTGDRWTGWSMPTATEVELMNGVQWNPWVTCFDVAPAPVVRWFLGGVTSAAFNELDRQVLRGHGDAVAFVADSSSENRTESMNLHELLVKATLAAFVLRNWTGRTSGRMALYLPNDLRVIVWISAAKRVAMPYVAVANGTSSSSLADRLVDTGATLLVTSAIQTSTVKGAFQLMEEPPAGWLIETAKISSATSTPQPAPVEGFSDASSALYGAHVQFLANSDGKVAESLRGTALVAPLWQLIEPSPVEANFPLFILYTSGSTGRHVQGHAIQDDSPLYCALTPSEQLAPAYSALIPSLQLSRPCLSQHPQASPRASYIHTGATSSVCASRAVPSSICDQPTTSFS